MHEVKVRVEAENKHLKADIETLKEENAENENKIKDLEVVNDLMISLEMTEQTVREKKAGVEKKPSHTEECYINLGTKCYRAV